MKQKLYLHIGLPKTGTTTIQQVLDMNADKLKKKGLVWAPHWLYVSKPEFRPREKALKFIDEHVGTSRDIIVSHEAISVLVAKDPANFFFQERFPSLDIKVIVYLRRQDLHLESVVNFMKTRKNTPGKLLVEDFEETSAEYLLNLLRGGYYFYDYHRWLESLAAMIGRENITVKVFEPAKFKNGDLVDDFLELIGVPGSEGYSREKRMANESLDHRFTELYEHQYEAYPDMPFFEQTVSKQAMIALNRSMGETRNRNLFTHEQRLQLLDHYSEANALIARDYLGEDSLLFDQTIKSKELDKFKEGELEHLPVVLNKIWYETLATMDFSTFNSIKLRYYQKKYRDGDESAKKSYRLHKLINSIGRRFKKNFYEETIDFNIVEPEDR